MFGKKSVETLVVGAGPCGMLAALVLADNGNDVAIIDSAPRTCTSSNSAILHPLTLKTMDRIGLLDRLVDSGYRIDTITLHDGTELRETFRLNNTPVPFPYALSIPQSELELFLEDELEEAGVRVLWNHRASEYSEEEDGLNVTVDRYSDRGTGYAVSHTERLIDKTLTFRAQTLIAADGYNSTLRRMAKAETQPLGEGQYFLTFEVDCDLDPRNTLQVSLKDGLATAQTPMKGGRARLHFQFSGLTLPSRNREKQRSFFQERSSLPDYLDESSFEELVKERVPWKTGYFGRIHYRAAIPFEKRYLEKPLVGNVVFLGDAARSFGPLGSLSLNLGLQEAEQIATAILTATSNSQSRSSLLEQAVQGMPASWKRLSRLEEFTNASELADPWVDANRGRILRALPATGATLQYLAEQAQLRIELIEYAPSLH